MKTSDRQLNVNNVQIWYKYIMVFGEKLYEDKPWRIEALHFLGPMDRSSTPLFQRME